MKERFIEWLDAWVEMYNEIYDKASAFKDFEIDAENSISKLGDPFTYVYPMCEKDSYDKIRAIHLSDIRDAVDILELKDYYIRRHDDNYNMVWFMYKDWAIFGLVERGE